MVGAVASRVVTVLSQVEVWDQPWSQVNVFTIKDGCLQCSIDGLNFEQALGSNTGRRTAPPSIGLGHSGMQRNPGWTFEFFHHWHQVVYVRSRMRREGCRHRRRRKRRRKASCLRSVWRVHGRRRSICDAPMLDHLTKLFGHLHHRALEVANNVSQRLPVAGHVAVAIPYEALWVEIPAADVVTAGVGWPRCLAREAKLFSSVAIPHRVVGESHLVAKRCLFPHAPPLPLCIQFRLDESAYNVIVAGATCNTLWIFHCSETFTNQPLIDEDRIKPTLKS